MMRLAAGHRLGQHAPRFHLEPRGELAHRLALARQVEAEERHSSLERQRRLLVPAVKRQQRRVRRRVLAHEILGDLRPLDRGTRHAKAVGEVAQRARNGAPAAADARLRHARLVAPGRLLVNDEVERHHLRQQLGELALHRRRHVRHQQRQLQPDRAIDARHRQRRVLQRLHQHAAVLGPCGHAVVEQLSWQAVHLAQEAAARERLGVHVVRRQVVAARHHQSAQVAVVARHAMQALDARHHGHVRQQLVVAMHQQLGPRPVHRHRLDLLAVHRQPALVHDAARVEELERAAIAQLVERHRQVQLVGAHAQCRARERHALAVASQLELGSCGPQRLELDVAVAQYEHAPARHAPMHAPGHLQNLVGAEVQAREHVLAALHQVGEPRVVNDHRVEALHVQRALPGRRHRQQERLGLLRFEERADHANGLAAVIERDVHPRKTGLHQRRGLLDARARGQEHADAAFFLRHAMQELVVEEIQRLHPDDLHVGGLRRIKRAALDHLGGVQVAPVECRVHGGRQPDVAAAHALAEREAELELGRRLVDFVDHQRVLRTDVAVLEPAPRNAGGDDDDVPRRRLGRRLALAVDHADAQLVGGQHDLGDGLDAQRLAGTRPRHDAKPRTPRRRRLVCQALGERAQAFAVGLPQDGLDVERERQLDRLARGARGGNDDDAPAGPAANKVFAVAREVRISDRAQGLAYCGFSGLRVALAVVVSGVWSRSRSRSRTSSR